MAVIYRCLVVDDEPLARRVISRFIAELPWLELAAECNNAQTASACLREQEIDVMFLDIKMPGLSGLDFLKTLSAPPQVILTTAHSEYAMASYDYSVVDYLLKPISFDRFLKAVNKLLPDGSSGRRGHDAETKTDRAQWGKSIVLRADRVDHKVKLANICYLESYGNYVKVHLAERTLLVSGTLIAIGEMLPSDRFRRVHRSYIVALGKIEQLAKATVRISGVDLPVGRSYKREFVRAWKAAGKR